MRRVTRNLLLGIAAVVVLLLALGALPSYLQSGDPYYLTATPAEGTAPANETTAVDGRNLSERRYPYATAALADAADGAGGDAGRSEAYYRGPFGVKGAFTHSPFDELAGLRARYPRAVANDTAYVTMNGTTYKLTVIREERS